MHQMGRCGRFAKRRVNDSITSLFADVAITIVRVASISNNANVSNVCEWHQQRWVTVYITNFQVCSFRMSNF